MSELYEGIKGDVEMKTMSMNKIKLGKNSRLDVSDEEIAGLMQSIKEVGLLQPIGVVKLDNGTFEIAYGNRRFLAMSKLGKKTIPVIVHPDQDVDLKNLTENIQRRNISLTEAGRYIALLKETYKLTLPEIAVRLGVNKSYVTSCLNAFSHVPEEFQKDLELRVGNDTSKKVPGKISIKVANAIVNAQKGMGITKADVRKLFKAAKENDDFSPSNINQYVSAVKAGKKNPVKEASLISHCRVQFFAERKYLEELEDKFVTNGPFKTLNGLFVAVLKGEKSLHVKVVKG